MPQNSRGVTPLAWRSLVEETKRRRKAEGLTQREHAALAGVSVPTIAAFDRGERTLTLAKSFDILRVVGLIDEQPVASAEDAFMREAFQRWRDLVAPLPENAPARFSHGWYRIDYHLEGDLRTVSLTEYEGLLRQTASTRYTGWPVFMVLSRPEVAPREVDGAVECWLGEPTADRTFNDAGHSDFWRGAPPGRQFLMRGYQEDGEDTIVPGTIFDSTLPIWRMGEVLLHAENLTRLLHKRGSAPVKVHFRALYTGLSGRVIKAWANPTRGFWLEGEPARSDEAVLETVVQSDTITDQLPEHLLPLVASLYERFGVTGLTARGIQLETDRLLKNRR